MSRHLWALLVGVGLLGAVVAEAREPAPAGEVKKKKKFRRPGGSTDDAADEGVDKAGRRVGGMGESFLKQGNFRAAASAFRDELKKNPDAVAAHVGLGKALARMGRCTEGLAELWPHVGTKPFGDEAAILASVCSGRLGLLDDALYFARIGAEWDPDNPRALTQYALTLADMGDLYAADQIIGRLEVLPGPKDASLYAKAVLALRSGDIDAFDQIAWFWPADRASQRDLARLEAQSWLDVGNPIEVVNSIRQIKRMQRGRFSTWLRAEAVRRLGDPEDALDLLDTRNAKLAEGSESDSVRARVLVDLGDLEGAAALLDQYASDIDPEVTASAWYLARARGDRAAMADYARLHRTEESSPRRKLRSLIPWIDWPARR